MDEREVARYWDDNAEAWTLLSRMGCDTSRDLMNTPAFMGMLPPIAGKRGLDVGCGEGHNTRLLARQGADMAAVDISPNFIRHALIEEEQKPLGIHYQIASTTALPFSDATFDFIVSFMCLMSVPDLQRALTELYRVLKPGGFLQFSITHPCFQTPRWEWILDEQGRRTAMVCGDYFKEEQGTVERWMFSAAPPELKEKLPAFQTPRFFRTLTTWLNGLLDAGFILERFHEPTVTDDVLKEHPEQCDARTIAYFLIIQCRKRPVSP
jgi:ubiquinone/menaquinone biosynthesis C-methylase UbiE